MKAAELPDSGTPELREMANAATEAWLAAGKHITIVPCSRVSAEKPTHIKCDTPQASKRAKDKAMHIKRLLSRLRGGHIQRAADYCRENGISWDRVRVWMQTNHELREFYARLQKHM